MLHGSTWTSGSSCGKFCISREELCMINMYLLMASYLFSSQSCRTWGPRAFYFLFLSVFHHHQQQVHHLHQIESTKTVISSPEYGLRCQKWRKATIHSFTQISRAGSVGSAWTPTRCVVASSPTRRTEHFGFPPVLRDWVGLIQGLGMSSRIYATGHIKDPVPLIEKGVVSRWSVSS